MADLMHKAEIQEQVRAAYRQIEAPSGAAAVYYTPTQLADLPAGAIAWSLGVGNPLGHAELATGEQVLDLGCGSGVPDSVREVRDDKSAAVPDDPRRASPRRTRGLWWQQQPNAGLGTIA